MDATSVDEFEGIRAQLEKFHLEVSILSKGKPDNPINKFKLTLINEKLLRANLVLPHDLKPFKDFDIFDEDELPTNSDVVLILSQYLESLEAWRCANIHYVSSAWLWIVKGGQAIRTTPPTRFRRKK